ncbi:MAG: peptide-methionine (S)-S-oxide reductase MsrA [Armatimonas sp.]
MEGENEMADIIVGGGCFWCVEGPFELVRGVTNAESGYCGGQVPNPSYEQVSSGVTGHAEAVRITFDPKVVSAHDLLTMFFTLHDPTQLNAQGPDHGTQYRSVIFIRNAAEKKLAQQVIAEITEKKLYSRKIVTTLEPYNGFWLAEDYHQNYYARAEKGQNVVNPGYCQYIVAPKVAKFRKEWMAKLKK